MKEEGFKNFWLTVVIGSTLIFLVVLLGVSFFNVILNTQIQSRKEFLLKQTELAAMALEVEMNRFEDMAASLLDYLEDGDVDEDDFDEDFAKATRRIFNNYPGLVDTVWVNLQDSVVFYTRTARNDFIRSNFGNPVPKGNDREFMYFLKSRNGYEISFSLDLIRYTKDFVTNYYLNRGGAKFLMIGGGINRLDPGDSTAALILDETSIDQIRRDSEVRVIGLYEVQWKRRKDSGGGILIQYPFEYGEIYRDASLLFMMNSEVVTAGIYSTYLALFMGFVVLLICTIVFFTHSLRNNIASQKLLQENAKEISDLFDKQNLLLKELKGFVFFHDYKGGFTNVSDEVEHILGLSKERFLEAFRSDTEQKDVKYFKNQIYEAVNSKKSIIDTEYDFTRPDGNRIRLRIFEKLIFDEKGKFNAGLGICTDITKQHDSQQELIQSQNRLRNLIGNIPDVIFLYDYEGNIIHSHTKDGFPLTVPKKGIPAKNIRDLVSENNRTLVLEAFEKARDTGEIQTIEMQEGDPRSRQFYEVRYFPLDENQIMSISKDVTRQRIWEKGLVEAMNAADQASKAKSEFLANMSHEIRTPMNGLLGVIDLLEQTTLDRNQLQYLDIIKNSGNSLLSIIKNILDYSKIEAGKIDINPMVFSPAEEMEKQVRIFYALAQKKNITLTLENGPGTESLMEGDMEKINQVILNLVGNAVKFTPIGGIVAVKLDLEEISEQLFFLKCSVTDNGIGIPKEQIPMLTDPFYQVDSSISRTYQGTGLGLAIAKKIVELLGGEMSISSVLGKGSVFRFSVLVNKAKKVAVSKPKGNTPKRTSWIGMAEEFPMKILLVEDNFLNMQLMGLILKQLGYEFDVAKNGLEAFDRVIANDFDLVLMDVQMPVLNGLESCRKIRMDENKKDIFIIGLSANVFDEDQRKALESGMDDYLTKPIRLAALAEKLKEFSLRKSQRMEEKNNGSE